MFLSKISMDLSSREVALDLADRDRLHRKMLLMYPDFPGGGERNARELIGVLFRVEAPLIYLQSSIAPVSTRMPLGYKITATKEISASLSSLKEGAEYRFRLEANVSYREKESRRRRGLESPEERQEWLFRRGTMAGFEIVDYDTTDLPPIHARLGTFHAVRFDGVLKVKTVEPFLKAIREGVGPAKVYGCGLLSVGR